MFGLVKAADDVGLQWQENLPTPTIGRSDVLVAIAKTAICGTDLHIYKWDQWARSQVPLQTTIGHEFYGHIVEVGADVSHLKIGQAVSGEGHLVCHICRNCRAGNSHLCRKTRGLGIQANGAFAQYLALPASNTIALPEGFSPELGSILDPLGNAVHTALTFPVIGEDIFITGAGPIGLMAAAVCRHIGARHIVITDINPYRLALAEKIGVTRAIDPRKVDLPGVMRDLGMKEGFDVGLEMSGNISAFRSMIDVMNHGGKIANLGIFSSDVSLPLTEMIFKSLQLQGVYGRQMYETWHRMISMLQSGLDISPIITHRFPVQKFEKGFELMAEGKCGKVILEWPT